MLKDQKRESKHRSQERYFKNPSSLIVLYIMMAIIFEVAARVKGYLLPTITLRVRSLRLHDGRIGFLGLFFFDVQPEYLYP